MGVSTGRRHRSEVFMAVAIGLLLLGGCQAVDHADPDMPAERNASDDTGGGETSGAFGVAGLALWDGRPSLGGVWLAHPDVVAPQPALIRRVDTGAAVGGTLYRRARDLPGPAFALSAAAAEALGIEAGTPYPVEAIASERVHAVP